MSTFSQRVQLGPFFNVGVIQGAALMEHYEAGTSTLKNVWSDRGMTTPLAQPLVADADGIFNFFADGLYKLILKAPDLTVLYTLDNWQFIDRTDPTFGEGTVISSASTIGVGPEVFAHIGGSTNINTITGTIPFFWSVFDGNLTLVHSASLLLPDAQNYKVRTGEVVFFLNEGAGVWRLAGRWLPSKQTDIASASSITSPTTGSLVDITGTTDIGSIANSFDGHTFIGRFTNAAGCNLNHSAGLVSPWGRDYRTVTNELMQFMQVASSTWAFYSLNGPNERVGTTIESNTTTVPTGTLEEDGAAISRADYSGLFAEIANFTTATITVTIASPGVVTWTAHGLANGQPVAFTTTGALPTGLTANTQYYVSASAANTFQIAATIGGTAINTSGTQSGVHTGSHARYGVGNNSTTFNTPDSRGRASINVDGSANRITSVSTNGVYADTLGGAGGTETHLLTTAEMPAHTHTTGVTGNLTLGSGAGVTDPGSSATTTGSTGGGGVHSNTQPWIAKKKFIRY